jgi:PXPV repeat (3 copies)
MKTLAAVALLTVVLLPGAAFASSSTDAALGLGAFAVFNQILGGIGIFGGAARPVAVAPAPVIYTPPPAVVYGPPPVYVAPPPPVYYAPAPVVVAPQPVYVAPRPVFVYRAVPVYRHGGWGHRDHGNWGHRDHR